MSVQRKVSSSRASDYSKRPEIRSQFSNEAAYLSFLVRDKYCVNGNDENQYAERWNENHLKLLLILNCCGEYDNKHGDQKEDVEDTEQWIRHTPLLTFIYEGISQSAKERRRRIHLWDGGNGSSSVAARGAEGQRRK